MVSRQNERGKSAYDQICKLNKDNVDWIPTNLSSLKSVRGLAETIQYKYHKVDFLFNCAGIQLLKRTVTIDGLESMFAANYYDILKTAEESNFEMPNFRELEYLLRQSC